MAIEILHGCCIEQMAAMKAAGRTVQAIVTDPPYGLSFMGRAWDAPDNIAFRPETWRLAYDLLPPGGMLAAFGGARTQHRMACAIEDAGFTIFDTALWLYGSGFPKGKTQLKPAYEPIILARKPTKGPLRHLAIDACRVGTETITRSRNFIGNKQTLSGGRQEGYSVTASTGRWPSNILHDGSPEVLGAFAAFGERKARGGNPKSGSGKRAHVYGAHAGGHEMAVRNDTGSAARFYPALGFGEDDLRFMYASKASKRERQGANHPTIKPLALMRWLVRLITPPGGTVLDMFAGSGTTGLACQREGFGCVLVEREAEYVAMCAKRLGLDFSLEAAD